MIFRRELSKTVYFHSKIDSKKRRRVKKFAWLPVRLTEYLWVWLQPYYITYISVGETKYREPIWIKWELAAFRFGDQEISEHFFVGSHERLTPMEMWFREQMEERNNIR